MPLAKPTLLGRANLVLIAVHYTKDLTQGAFAPTRPDPMFYYLIPTKTRQNDDDDDNDDDNDDDDNDDDNDDNDDNYDDDDNDDDNDDNDNDDNELLHTLIESLQSTIA